MNRNKKNIFYQFLAVFLAFGICLGAVSPAICVGYALEDTGVAQIGDSIYDSLAEAIADVPTGSEQIAPATATEITLLKDTEGSFDVGTSNGTETKNIALNLGGYTLTLKPAVGSVGTVSNGIRVLAFSKLAVSNGTVVCADDAQSNIKTGFANYGTLVLDNVDVKSGALTVYTINNRGSLTLSGTTSVENGKVAQTEGGSDYIAITNDPYNLYYTSAFNATLTCDSDDVTVGDIQIERYERKSDNTGIVELAVTAGTFGEVFEDGASAVDVSYDITGGTFKTEIFEDTLGEEYYIVDNGDGSYSVEYGLEQPDFGFEIPNPADQWAGATFTNRVTGVLSTGAITYKIIEGADIATVDSDGVVSFNGKGTVTVEASVAADSNYRPAKAIYTISTYKVTDSDFAYSQNEVKIDCSETEKYINTTLVDKTGSKDITYSIEASNNCATIDSETGEVTVLSTGTATVTAKKAADSIYDVTTATYTIEIYTTAQDEIVVNAPSKIIFNTSVQDVLLISGGSGDGELIYTITAGNEYATIDDEGRIATLKAGGSFTVEVHKAGDDYYKQSNTETVEIYVDYADQTGFDFETKTSDKIVFNDNNNEYSNTASGGESTGSISYAITSGSDVADIDAQTGVITVKKSGTVTVVATKDGDDCYNPATAEYTLTVDRDEQKISVDNVNLTYGTKEYQSIVNEINVGTGEYTYSIEGVNSVGASIDEKTGLITFESSVDKVGSFTVKVYKAADDCYNACEIKFNVTVSYLETDAVPTLSGATKNDSGWYTGPVSISAPAGYSISYYNNLSTSDWADSVTFAEEGVNSATVYLKDADGYITDSIGINNIRIDTAAPTALSISYDDSFWENIVSSINFGIYSKDTVEVTISATDANSGVDYLTYNVGGEDITVDKSDFNSYSNGTATYTFEISAQFRNKITMSATDTSGWTSELVNSDHVLVLDTINPELKVSYNDSSDYKELVNAEGNSVHYSKGSVDVVFSVTEDNFDISNKPVVTVNSETKNLNWTKNDTTGNWESTLSLSADGTYNINVTYADGSENEMDAYSKTVIVDTTVPVISVSYNNNEALNGNNYNTDRVATIKITEKNFNAENVVVNATAVDVQNNEINATLAEQYAEYVKNPDNWSSDGDVHTAKITYSTDAIYTFDIDCSDIIGNNATDYVKDEFVVDHNAPTDFTISYSTPVLQKIIESITFRLYKAPVTVTLTANDITSGVDYFEWEYKKQDGASNNNTDELSGKITSDRIIYTENGLTATATFSIPAQARGYILAKVTDKAGNTTNELVEDKNILIVDDVAPVLDVEFNDAVSYREYNDIHYANGDVDVVFSITEDNFDVTNLPVVKVGTMPIALDWTYNSSTDAWVSTLELSGNGTYDINVTYADGSGNEMDTYSKTVIIDELKPVISVVYDNNNASNGNNYNADRTALLTITESNFLASEVKVTVTATDIEGNDVDINSKDYAGYAANEENWTANGNVWTLDLSGMKFDIDAIYTFDIEYTDLANNAAEDYEKDVFVIDHAVPTAVKIEYSSPVLSKTIEKITFGYYKAPVMVKLSAEDVTSGVDYFTYSYIKELNSSTVNTPDYTETITSDAITYSNNGKTATATFEIPAQARGYVTASATDKAGNSTAETTDSGRINVVDDIDPERTVSYNPERIFDAETKIDVYSFEENDNVILYYTNEAVVTFTVTEANFYEEDIVIKVNGKEVAPTDWTKSGDIWTGTITISGDGDYVVTMTYTDRSGNEMKEYTSPAIAIDATEPVVTVDYDNNDALNGNNYDADRTASITIEDHNFRADDVKVTVTAEDVQGNVVDISSKGYSEYASDRDNWTQNGDVWTLNTDGMKFDIDAKYTFDIEYSDILGNDAADYEADEFVIDHVAPTDVTIEYSTPDFLAVLETLTFGYYKAPVTVILTANDITSGVNYFTYSYVQEPGSSEINLVDFGGTLDNVDYSNNGLTATATFEIPAQARGYVTASATDMADNTTVDVVDSNRINVVDNIDPERTVSYAPERIFDAATMLDVENFNEGDDVILYYTNKAVVTLTVTEANFYEEDIVIKVNDKEVAPTDWTQNGDIWTGTITISGDGDYVVTMTYTDRSGNEMKEYTSPAIAIDATAPVVKVEYDNNDALNENNYDADRTASITIEDHNFRADDVKVTVTAEDVQGNVVVDIGSKRYSEYACDRDNWTQNGDVWTLNTNGMKFDIDAKYTFDIEYSDIIGNKAEDYETDEFVIDHVAPTDVIIEYSTHVFLDVLETLTLGFYKAPVTVTLTSDDITSGVDYFVYTYIQQEGSSSINASDYTKTINTQSITYSNKGLTATATFEIPAQARGYVTASATDMAGNTNDSTVDSGRINIVDNLAPEREVTYAPERIFDAKTMLDVEDFKEGDDVILYYHDTAVVTFTVNEANFYEEDVVIKVNDEEVVPTDWTQNGDIWTGTITISGDGDYVVTMTYTDRSGNVMEEYTSPKIAIDAVPPVVTVKYDNNNALNENNYKANRTATITIEEHNFRADDVKVTVTAKDVQGKVVKVENYAEYLSNRKNWTTNGDVHTAKITYSTDAIYTFDIEYSDIIGNSAADYVKDKFVVDHKAPTDLKISYSTSVVEKVIETLTFGYYKSNVTVTLTADDITSGVDYFVWTYTQQSGTSDVNKTKDTKTITSDAITYSNSGKTATASFKISAQARGYIAANVTDKAGNTSSTSDKDRINVVDNIAPEREVTYTPERIFDAKTMLDVKDFKEGDDVILYYHDTAVVTFTVNEANFYEEDVVIKVNGKKVAPTDWKKNGDVWTGTIKISGDGDYVVTMTYTDRSGNVMKSYTSPKIAIDSTAPVVTVKYDNNNALNENNFKANRTATITIKEHNFRADDVKVTVTAKDVQGKVVKVENYAEYLSNRKNWTTNGDVHTAKITYSTDAIYTFDIDYSDIIENSAKNYVADKFVVDHKAPTDLKISYSTSVVEKVIETLTFGYYKSDVTVTLTADDITSGVDYFVWSYTQQSGTSDVNKTKDTKTITSDAITYSNSGKTATASFKISAQARGYIAANVTDKAGNTSNTSDNGRINVVDNIAPVVAVTYTADSADTSVQFATANDVTVESFADADIAYYNGSVTAAIVVEEANFFEGKKAVDGVIHQIGIKLTQTDNNGKVTVFEYLPEGARQMYPGAIAKAIKWTSTGDTHSFKINYAENADYVLEIKYADLSSNASEISSNDSIASTNTYKSKIVTVDTIAPVVTVEYENDNVINTFDGRKYFDADQYAIITVDEHNFRADDFAATVVAKDVIDQDVKVENFAATLSDDNNWTQNGNIYKIKIKYTVDANYSFDFTYEDLAHNTAAAYATDLFTVDATAPENLKVTYSTSVFEEILSAITFGYYDAEMVVEISADDSTTAIDSFVYSYIKSEGVSDVNAELINDRIKAADNKISTDGKTFSTSFAIPKKLLNGNNQFNGTVEFTAYDRSGNSTKKVDNTRIIVDNINPVAQVSFNAPVQTTNDISYYAGDINAKIVITEANFFAEDVVVRVTRDGNNYPVNVNWEDNSVDVHTGTFTLTQDGDYVITITYQDRSTNSMDSYTSNQLTIDTAVPAVSVSNIKNNSANKDETYGFTITASDINIDVSSFVPVLTAIVRNANGAFEVKTVSLGSVEAVESGSTYSFTINNLSEDAVYSLVCTLKDMAGNEYSKILLGDGEEYSDVRFSVNRKGSTFAINENVQSMVDQYYIYEVYENIVIEEVNVDPIETYTVKLNGNALTEGKDYETKLTSNSGEWSKRTYTIFKDVFAQEGEYNIVVESVDKVESTAYSDVKDVAINFVVDKTAPVLTISGLESNQQYQVEEQTVTVIPTDDGGRLSSLKVVILDSDGNPIVDASGADISERFNMADDALRDYLAENDGKITFIIPEGFEQQIQIICSDCAENADGKTNEYNQTFESVTVSPNGWIIFYANKTAFYGSIAGVVSLASAITLVVFFKKRRKSK